MPVANGELQVVKVSRQAEDGDAWMRDLSPSARVLSVRAATENAWLAKEGKRIDSRLRRDVVRVVRRGR